MSKQIFRDGEKITVEKTDNLYPEQNKPKTWDNVRSIRDSKLGNTDWYARRHEEHKNLGISTDLTDRQYQNLLQYRQNLRDITEDYENASDVSFPLSSRPSFLKI